MFLMRGELCEIYEIELFTSAILIITNKVNRVLMNDRAVLLTIYLNVYRITTRL